MSARTNAPGTRSAMALSVIGVPSSQLFPSPRTCNTISVSTVPDPSVRSVARGVRVLLGECRPVPVRALDRFGDPGQGPDLRVGEMAGCKVAAAMVGSSSRRRPTRIHSRAVQASTSAMAASHAPAEVVPSASHSPESDERSGGHDEQVLILIESFGESDQTGPEWAGWTRPRTRLRGFQRWSCSWHVRVPSSEGEFTGSITAAKRTS